MPKFGQGQKSGRKPGGFNKRTRAIKERLLREEALTVEATVEAIRRGLTFDLRRLLDTDGNFKPLTELSEEEAWCIAGWEQVVKNAKAGDGHTDTVIKMKLMPRGHAVELAAKYLGMLTEKVEVSGSDDLIAALLAGRKRAAESRKA